MTSLLMLNFQAKINKQGRKKGKRRGNVLKRKQNNGTNKQHMV